MDHLPGDNSSSDVHELDLIPMIAIFSMLILFLIAGTVLTEGEVAIPTHLKIPKGLRKEKLSSSPQIIINKGKVKVSTYQQEVDFLFFSTKKRNTQIRRQLRKNISDYKNQAGQQNQFIPFQIVADRSLSYSYLYDIINELRYDGIETFLFVSEVNH